MKVLDIILAAATELGIADEVNDYVSGGSENAKADTENLLRAFNLVENELALDYLPLRAEEEVETTTGAIEYSAFSRSVVRILQITDTWGNELEFKLFPDYVKTQCGKVRVCYTYTPTEKTFTDESEFHALVSVRLFAYGIASEFCLASGRFEEAAIWDKKYKQAIAAAYRAKPVKKISSRRWV